MRTIAKIFGRSPFVPLQTHMARVAQCVAKVPDLIEAFLDGRSDDVARLAGEISELEHAADEVKHDIQNQLHKGMFLLVDRAKLLEIVAVQDSIADKVENLGVLLTLKAMSPPADFVATFRTFLDKNLEAFDAARKIVEEMHDLVESSFGGPEAQKIGQMVHQVAVLEHEADLIQHDLLRELFAREGAFTHGEFYLWTQIFRQVGEVANLSERLANRIRVTLELK